MDNVDYSLEIYWKTMRIYNNTRFDEKARKEFTSGMMRIALARVFNFKCRTRLQRLIDND